MACDLKKNKEPMLEAFEDVRGDSDNDWVVFGYEKDNRTLKVNETGEDGYEEMMDELGETRAVYAVIKMKDPNSGLPKMLQINWLPDGLPAAIKAVVSRHVMDVERMLPGVHVRLNARYEDDVSEKALLAKISKASGANYGVHKEKKKDYGPIGKTGTNYIKTDATKEVDVKQRNAYMNKQQEEDAKRIRDEQKQKVAERVREDKERRERENQESAARNEVTERKAKVVQARKDQEAAESKQQEEEAKQRWREEQVVEAERMTEAEQNAEDDKRKRWEEERERISDTKSSTMSDADREGAWQEEKERRWEEERDNIRQQRADAVCDEGEEEHDHQTRKSAAWEEERARISAHVRAGHQEEEEEPQQYQQEQQEEYHQEQPQQEEYQQEESHAEPEPEPEAEPEPEPEQEAATEPTTSVSSGVSCKAVYDYQAEDDTEISIDPEEMITDVDQTDESWWVGTNSHGQRGMFPANYVEVC